MNNYPIPPMFRSSSSSSSSSSTLPPNPIMISHAQQQDLDPYNNIDHHQFIQDNGYIAIAENINSNNNSNNIPVIAGTENEMGPGEGKSSTKGEKKSKKQPRYAFQTRSQVDILDDGYRWRKYGQKAVKNNKFPRSYYRCTHQGCNVKKQVQRLSKDEGIVVTTYEGMHSHAIQKSTDNFEHILSQMQIYTSL
ncbi:hypothetical protein ABFS82_11G074500 [Erythranthe guttata]